MIIGTGVDIIEVDRIAEKLKRSAGLKEKIFSPEEIAFCEQKPECFQHYAARFAAKEAFLKATGLGLTLGHDLHHVQVVHDEYGRPGLQLTGVFLEHARNNNWNKIHVSLSHIRSAACAVVIIESR
jgi:holo-[acyl-carrier protein] synthase